MRMRTNHHVSARVPMPLGTALWPLPSSLWRASSPTRLPRRAAISPAAARAVQAARGAQPEAVGRPFGGTWPEPAVARAALLLLLLVVVVVVVAAAVLEAVLSSAAWALQAGT